MEKTTNLEKIKEIAQKHFDAYDISVEPMDAVPMPDDQGTVLFEAHCHITHPFFRTLFGADTSDAEIALYNALNDPVEFEKVKTKLLHDVRTTLSEITDPVYIFSSLMSSHSVSFIKETKQFLSLPDYSRVLRVTGVADQMILSPSERAQFKSDILDLFDESFVRQNFMYDMEQNYYDALPDVVTVYRGVNEDIEDYEVSDIFWWTAEIENLVPTEDAGPYESDEGIVYEAKIRKEDIYAYLAGDGTIFLNPDKLFNILHHKNFPLDDIELRDEDMIRR